VWQPDARHPDDRHPDAWQPDAPRPDAWQPDARRPDDPHPDAWQPDARHPDDPHPDAWHPGARHPDAWQPDARRPDTRSPDHAAFDTGRLDVPVPERNLYGAPPGGAATATAASATATATTTAVPSATVPAGARKRTRAKAGPAEPGPRPELPYVGAFDGIRAIALFAVLAFHQGFEVARGGFLGISSFFTLSGFLVATFALAEWAQGGRLALGRLWERRARRILPALLFTLGLVVVLQTVWRVGTGPGYRGDVLAAVAQALNWRFALNGEGFASVLTDPSPVQHLWSLSLLVQVTVVFPLAFVGVMRVTGRHWRTAGALFAAAAAASFVAASLTADRSGNDGLAYYGTHTRVGELLVGVVLAYVVLSPGVRRLIGTAGGVRAVRLGAPAALVVLAWLWHTTGLYSTNLFGGVTALNAVLTAWVIFAATVPGPAATVLGSLPLRTIGKVSFAAYLLHWPLFLLLDEERTGLDGPVLFLVRVAATLVAAAAVTYGLERPFRTGLRAPRAQLAGALAVCAAVVAAATVLLPEQPPAGVELSVDDGNGAGDLDVVVPTGSGDENLSLAVVGGTLADSLEPGFTAWNADNADDQVRVHTHVAANCPLSGPGPVRLAGEVIGEDTTCLGFGPRLPELLDAAEPDAVLVVPGVGDLGEREIDREWLHLGDPVYDDWLRDRLTALADTLEDAGVPVIWATSPHVRLPPGGELEGDWTTVADNDPARVDRLNEIIRDIAADRDDSTVLDIGAWAQRLPRGEFAAAYRAEGRDLTEDGAVRAVAWLIPEVHALLA
jgi:peptidoglycan/LPS O-acetylase OafA/YrhL